MLSMTGFGLGEAALGEGRVTLELRALNHRFLEVRVRLPVELQDQSSFVEQQARERLTRGRFDIGVRLTGPALPIARFSVERARSVYAALLDLRDALSPGADVPLSAVTAFPELVTAPAEVDSEALRAALTQAFEHALAQLDLMRRREGDTLGRELASRIASCRQLVAAVRERSNGSGDVLRQRLRERVERLLSVLPAQADPGRLETEIALLADKSDITEELVRLDSHFSQFDHIAGSRGPVGRQLEFLLQEIGREANTIGAKSQDAAIAHLVVELKTEIERMREQVHNVE